MTIGKMHYSRIFILMSAVAFVAFCTLATPTQYAYASDVSNKLSAATYQTAYETHYLNESQTQAVVVTASDSEYHDAQIWLVTSSGAKHIYTPEYLLYPKTSFLCKVKGGAIFKIEEGAYGSCSISRVWFIKNSSAKLISGIGMDFGHVKGNAFYTVRNKFDSNKYNGMWTGHTFNRYYLKWTGTKFVEYGGKKISLKTLRRAKNGSKIISAIKAHEKNVFGEKTRIDKVFYRANGIVNINVSTADRPGIGRSYRNYTLRLKGKSLVFCKQGTAKKCSIANARSNGIYAKKSGFVSAPSPKKFPV